MEEYQFEKAKKYLSQIDESKLGKCQSSILDYNVIIFTDKVLEYFFNIESIVGIVLDYAIEFLCTNFGYCKKIFEIKVKEEMSILFPINTRLLLDLKTGNVLKISKDVTIIRGKILII